MTFIHESYPRFTALQGLHYDFGIYRRFAEVNARNLLYLRAEIADLEETLKQNTTEDLEASEEDRQLCSRTWYKLSRKPSGIHNKQWSTMLLLRAKLNEYSE